jgi:demethylmenaquinone methyltransferase / 2-methoxy-6-polyprenyl-1,4-benzoquinol methylase
VCGLVEIVIAIAYVSLMNHDPSGIETKFGFRDVEKGQKQGLVNEVFAKSAARYDQMNDLMSGGLHRLWKDDFVTQLNPPRNDRAFNVLDVAGGTGDIAFRTHVTIADISPDMVGEGKRRAEAGTHASKVDFTVGNAESLAFEDQSFDAYTIAFGIRNVPNIPTALKEAYRVLKPGGRFMCLEFSHLEMDALQKIYDAYSFTVIPAVGKVVTGDGQPYRYLVESIRTFTGGTVAIHSGWRI